MVRQHLPLKAITGQKNGIYKLHKLTKREKGQLPAVHVVDLREELKNDNKSIFSLKLQELIKDRLEKKQQVMLFINRRGICRICVLQRLWESNKMTPTVM